MTTEIKQARSSSAIGMSGLLLEASRHVYDLPGFHEEVEILQQKAERLKNQTFTIALFGAFSAGKSSVANCLLGDMVLPVSPNPTTAAINKILPPTNDYTHGTVRVFLKSSDDIWEDIRTSLQVFGAEVTNIEEAIPFIQSLSPEGMQSAAKPHFSFLKAVVKGWESLSPHLGECLTIDLKEFKSFVVKEEKACFAELIELYYDSPLAQKGIVLVDTPGADSINARHTGVAFEYIKNADAILFVTYYNHAFGKADEEFLLQLGRVKDTFALDKMFFLVNASDLAQSEEELDGVVAHVRKNLIRCGISNPRIYPVSSQTGLLARMAEKGPLPASAEKVYRQRMHVSIDTPLPDPAQVLERFGVIRFENEFYTFIEKDLTAIALRASVHELKRIADRVDLLNQSARADQASRKEMLSKLLNEQQSVLDQIQGSKAESERTMIVQEQNELLYYVKQRLFLRYRDLFLEAFNPSVLQDEYKDIKQRLKNCLLELVQSITFTIQQEMRATSLRMDKMCQKAMNHWIEKLQAEISSIQPNLILRSIEIGTMKTPDFVEQLEGNFSSVLSYYKNARDFFEQGKKDKMRDELEKLLKDPVDQLVEKHQHMLNRTYVDTWESRLDEVKKDLQQQCLAFYEGMRFSLSDSLDLEKLEQVDHALHGILAAAGQVV
jgi:replication fork clamp-binding protein CrfC